MNDLILILSIFSMMIACRDQTADLNSVIDRKAVVQRHNVHISSFDSLASLSVGNGEFAYTVDITGLQSYPESYVRGVSLGTQSQWGWHSFPDTSDYQINEADSIYSSCNDIRYPVAIQYSNGRKADAANYFRQNPHRMHLGLVGLLIHKENGQVAKIEDLENIDQTLDLWSGQILSNFEIEGTLVTVSTYVHQQKDQISFKVESDLIRQNRLYIKLDFPYSDNCHTCPNTSWDAEEKHESILSVYSDGAKIQRRLDTNSYQVRLMWNDRATIQAQGNHHFLIKPSGGPLTCSILFSEEDDHQPSTFEETVENNISAWSKYWERGGIIDFSACTDPRASELERRVILSQYLTRIQCAGSLPPQETGLTFNSWYGKFHLEMHWWHGVHFALWQRPDLLERSMPWYDSAMKHAMEKAEKQGFTGSRWQKMTGPEAISSPSGVGEFLIWQQPHPIYFSELMYRQKPHLNTLEKYKDLVFTTAEFMASFAQFNQEDGYYHLCHPIIPAQEIFHASQTNDPPFELVYWHFGLRTAIEWKKRLGEQVPEKWVDVLEKLTPLPQTEHYYLPASGAIEAYSDPENRRDHPIVSGIYGILPGIPELDTTILLNTLKEISDQWQWETTWGWDYPMLAMCAARLGQADLAIDFLMKDVQKNTYLKNGHNYQDQRLRIYLPGNGGLLTAVAMMAAGWDNGPPQANPGFPQGGNWKIYWENLSRMP